MPLPALLLLSLLPLQADAPPVRRCPRAASSPGRCHLIAASGDPYPKRPLFVDESCSTTLNAAPLVPQRLCGPLNVRSTQPYSDGQRIGVSCCSLAPPAHCQDTAADRSPNTSTRSGRAPPSITEHSPHKLYSSATAIPATDALQMPSTNVAQVQTGDPTITTLHKQIISPPVPANIMLIAILPHEARGDALRHHVGASLVLAVALPLPIMQRQDPELIVVSGQLNRRHRTSNAPSTLRPTGGVIC